jgi:sigma-B regulation protein RsbU (phosphoserine phosphatase)
MTVREQSRLDEIRRYEVLDTPPDPALDRITALTAALFDVPVALITIVDDKRIWFKSVFGLDGVTEIGLDPGFCTTAIEQSEPYIIESARSDPRTAGNPLVTGNFGLQFYAAAPLETASGARLGTLCSIDREPRVFSPRQAAILQRLSRIVMDELDLRLMATRSTSDVSGDRRTLT